MNKSYLPVSSGFQSFSPDAANAADSRVSAGGLGQGVAAQLGTNADLSPPLDQKSELRAERYRLQGHAQRILWNEGAKAGLEYPANFHKTIKCLRVRISDKVDIHQSCEHGTAFYGGGLVTCGKPGCTTCSSKIQERRRIEISQAFEWSYNSKIREDRTNSLIEKVTKDLEKERKEKNPLKIKKLERKLESLSNLFGKKKVIMVTLTFSHSHDQALDELLTKQAECLKKLRKGKSWDSLKSRMGYAGMIRSLEVTHGKNGWHPHTHEGWIVDKETDAEALKEYLIERWLRICQKEGLCPPGKEDAFREHSVDVQDECRASHYFAKMDDSSGWGVDRELAKSSTKKGRKAGRSVFQILADGADGCNSSDRLYVEFVESIKGRPIIRWSQGLKALVGVDDLTDEELAASHEDKADLLALLDAEDWRIVIAHDARSKVLDLAESGGWEAIKEWLVKSALPLIDESKEIKTYKDFCTHYDLDIDKDSSNSQYVEYRNKLHVLNSIELITLNRKTYQFKDIALYFLNRRLFISRLY